MFIFLFSLFYLCTASLPTVLVHGILSDIDEITPIEIWLEQNNITSIYRVEIGNGVYDSIFMNMNNQLDLLCKTIYAIDDLKDGFNFIGLSQGGLLARGYVQKCNKFPVKTLITWATPHEGVDGLSFIDVYFDNIYGDFEQSLLSFPGYWKDPGRYQEYLDRAQYLPFMNNEIPHSNRQLYKENILSLKNFIMIWSPIDGTIRPVRSCKFGFLKELFQSDQYLLDLIGLKTLDQSGRLHIHQIDCDHSSFKNGCFEQLRNVTLPYLI